MAALQATRAVPRRGAWLTLGQACRVLGVDESTLRRWADSGQVRAFRTPGGHRRFAEPDIQELVSGHEHGGRRYGELGELAVKRIRRQLNRRRAREAPWYATVDERGRERLRPLGRRLAALAADYLGGRARRDGALEEARKLGNEYGRELAAGSLPLAQAVEAFVFFRRGLDDATKQASQGQGLSADETLGAREEVTALADQVLIGLTEAYERAASSRSEVEAAGKVGD